MNALTITTTGNVTLDAAIQYAREGVHEFPVDSETKRPLIKGWQEDATTDEKQIKEWWRKWPGAMIGAPTGERNKFWALDIDGSKGAAFLAALEATYGDLPSTLCTKTPGGEHRLFAWEDGLSILTVAGEMAPNLDTRGGRADGSSTGFVVLPPSKRADGGEYKAVGHSAMRFTIGFDLPIASPWIKFLGMFNQRQRDQLKTEAGIAGPEAFKDAPLAEWRRLADEALGNAWRRSLPMPNAPLSREGSDAVVHYVTETIPKILAPIPGVGLGDQEKTMNQAALDIQSLLKGARLRGVDAKAVADIEAEAFTSYCAAVVSMQCFKDRKPWTQAHARRKWEHTREGAHTRNLFHVGATDADKEFADVASAGETPKGKLLEYPSDISLEAIRLQEANALVKGLLYPGETAMLYGASTAGKSFLALDLGWHIALGREWHGRRVKQAAVLYVTLEDEDGFRKRMLAYVKVMGDPGKNFALLVPHVSLVKADRGAEGAKCIIKAARELVEASGLPVGLIIIDTFARATAGDDVDGTAEMTSFVENRLGVIARETRALPLVVHHTNAAGTVKNNRALGDACNAVLRTDRNEYRRRLTAEKVKNGAEVPLFDYTLEEVQIDKEDDGSPIVGAVVRTKPVEPSTPGAKREKPKKTPKQLLAFREAFEAACAVGPVIETPSTTIEGLTLSKVPLSEVREEFCNRYPTGVTDVKAAQDIKARQWRTALDHAAQEFEFGLVDGVEHVWRRADLIDPHHLFDGENT
jgi:AAA domain/Bifunctional DNA primase/polymerase, N-terminal